MQRAPHGDVADWDAPALQAGSCVFESRRLHAVVVSQDRFLEPATQKF